MSCIIMRWTKLYNYIIVFHQSVRGGLPLTWKPAAEAITARFETDAYNMLVGSFWGRRAPHFSHKLYCGLFSLSCFGVLYLSSESSNWNLPDFFSWDFFLSWGYIISMPTSLTLRAMQATIYSASFGKQFSSLFSKPATKCGSLRLSTPLVTICSILFYFYFSERTLNDKFCIFLCIYNANTYVIWFMQLYCSRHFIILSMYICTYDVLIINDADLSTWILKSPNKETAK